MFFSLLSPFRVYLVYLFFLLPIFKHILFDLFDLSVDSWFEQQGARRYRADENLQCNRERICTRVAFWKLRVFYCVTSQTISFQTPLQTCSNTNLFPIDILVTTLPFFSPSFFFFISWSSTRHLCQSQPRRCAKFSASHRLCLCLWSTTQSNWTRPARLTAVSLLAAQMAASAAEHGCSWASVPPQISPGVWLLCSSSCFPFPDWAEDDSHCVHTETSKHFKKKKKKITALQKQRLVATAVKTI